ncbi:MAG: riboflavin biosynthesis protein RibD [Gammaproteobacteria bacterium]|nr:riboflavin biosynthesis protein RibD [Gammaproteobacteria bacterium]|tara:strand:+ start:86291 stop:87310 length:1020 start_codon:yes stop_codon:yes gene_type:complete
MNYEKFMLQAITNANYFKYTAKPNPVVGAILVKDDQIISEGYHEAYGKNHAEINALANAEKEKNIKFNNFSELTLICSLEPCSHVGKTESCARRIAASGIKKVIIGSIDPNPKVSGKGIKILKENNIKVEVGMYQDLVTTQNKFFFFKHKNNRPYITAKIAQSADGKSHYKNNTRAFITSKKSMNDVQNIRAQYDGILTGGSTLRNDDPRMNARVNFPVNQPKKILMSKKDLSSSEKSKYKFFKDPFMQFKENDLHKVIKFLKNTDICSVLLEAGPRLVNEFLKKGYIDELIIYTSQKDLGKDGVNWFKKDNAVENYGFKLESSYKIDADLKEIFIKDE